jgi:aminoglycoside 6'-N-acetyltransferase I
MALAVAESHRRRGWGRALVEDLERLVKQRGGVTLWLGSDDELGETKLRGNHRSEFGKPDIFFAKRLV